MIIDAHHHLWDLSEVDYPWLQAKGAKRFFGDPAPIQRDYDVADFKQDWSGLPIVGSVHIQVGASPEHSVRETQWLENRAEDEGFPSAIVGFADLASEDAMSVVDQHLAASARLRGIRHIVSRHPSEDTEYEGRALMDHALFRENLRHLVERGLSYDLQLTPPHLLGAAHLLSDLPDLPVALCHAGSPWSQDATGLANWKIGLEAMAELPSVTCKLSGLGMFDRDWTTESLRPIVDAVIDIFGSKRVMWGSNFPVDKLYHTYPLMVESLNAIIPSEMRRDIFFETANRFYRLWLSPETS